MHHRDATGTWGGALCTGEFALTHVWVSLRAPSAATDLVVTVLCRSSTHAKALPAACTHLCIFFLYSFCSFLYPVSSFPYPRSTVLYTPPKFSLPTLLYRDSDSETSDSDAWCNNDGSLVLPCWQAWLDAYHYNDATWAPIQSLLRLALY